MINGHGGNIYAMAQRLGCTPFEIIDMSSNVNPLGPPPGLVSFLKEHINEITALPEVNAKRIVNDFARRFHVNPDLVLAGNGTTQFIYAIPKALETKRALILGPTYADYADACIMHKVDFAYFFSEEPDSFKPDIDRINHQIKGFDTVFICNPNNPTGTLIPASELEMICRTHSKTHFIIDESYLPFVADGDKKSLINSEMANVIVLNSMSKIFRIPGLRIGFLVSSQNIIEKLIRYLLPWNVNSLAQAAVLFLMSQNEETDAFIKKTRSYIENEKKLFAEKLEDAQYIKLFPSTTSFFLARLFGSLKADAVCTHLSRDRILIRNCTNFKGLSDSFVRISLKTRDINYMLAEKLLGLKIED